MCQRGWVIHIFMDIVKLPFFYTYFALELLCQSYLLIDLWVGKRMLNKCLYQIFKSSKAMKAAVNCIDQGYAGEEDDMSYVYRSLGEEERQPIKTG